MTCRTITRRTFGELLLPHYPNEPQELAALLRENRITQALIHACVRLHRKIPARTAPSPEDNS